MANRMGLRRWTHSTQSSSIKSHSPNMPTPKTVIEKGKLDFSVIETAQNPSEEWVGALFGCLFLLLLNVKAYIVFFARVCAREMERDALPTVQKKNREREESKGLT